MDSLLLFQPFLKRRILLFRAKHADSLLNQAVTLFDTTKGNEKPNIIVSMIEKKRNEYLVDGEKIGTMMTLTALLSCITQISALQL